MNIRYNFKPSLILSLALFVLTLGTPFVVSANHWGMSLYTDKPTIDAGKSTTLHWSLTPNYSRGDALAGDTADCEVYEYSSGASVGENREGSATVSPTESTTYAYHCEVTAYPHQQWEYYILYVNPQVEEPPPASLTVNAMDGASWYVYCGDESGTGYGTSDSYTFNPDSDGESCTVTLSGTPDGWDYSYTSNSDGSGASMPLYPGDDKSFTLHFTEEVVPPPAECNDGPSGYTKCADEGGTCSFDGDANVAYGCGGAYYYEDAEDSISCSNSVFGDPAYGVVKACFYKEIEQNPPYVYITASPSTIDSGDSTMLHFISTYATSCTLNVGGSTVTGTSAYTTAYPTETTVYTVYCSNSAGSANDSVTVTVTDDQTLTTSIASGSGSISGSGISCPNDCSQDYSNGTSVTLTATPSTGYEFSSWSGACSGQDNTCTLQMSEDKSTSASFSQDFSYSLSNSGNVSIQQGGVNQYDTTVITKTLTAGTSKAVTLSASAGVPTGVSVSFSNQGSKPTSNSTATITVSPTATPGTYPITVTGSPLSKTTSFNLTVVDSPDLTVSCSASPSSVKLGEPVTLSASVEGGSGEGYTYSWSGLGISATPAPTSNPATITYSTIGTKTAQVTVTDSLQNQGTCSPGASVDVSFDPEFEEF